MQSPNEYLRRIEDEQYMQDQQPRPRRGWLKRLLLGLFVIAILVLAGGLWFAQHTLRGISSRPFDLSGLAADSSGRTNVLILGVGDPGHAGQNLSDSIMVVSFNKRTNQVATISVPRDTEVDIDGYGYRKINNAYALGKTELANKTVSQTLGLPVHYTVVTNFSGLKQLVDAVGGLDINVKQALVDDQYPCADNQWLACGTNIQPGIHHMDGAKVLEYTRCRKGTCGNDFGRAERQQEVIDLLMQELIRPTVWLNPIQTAAVSNALRTGLQTDLSGPNMVRLARLWQKKSGEPIRWVLSTAPGGMLRSAGSGNLVPIGGDFEAIQKQANEIFTSPPQKVVE